MKRSFLALAVLAFLPLGGCSGSGRIVTQAELGERWPLTVPIGSVDCVRGGLVFRHDGTEYALNGIAMGMGYSRIDPIWKSNPNSLIPKVDISPLMDLARQECR